jgi:predicted kinase
VSGPAGYGKTTLAHELAAALGCPAVCRDEIKEGMLVAATDFDATPGDELSLRARAVFFDVLGLLVEGGVTVVAEAAFQNHVWSPNLAPLADVTDLRIVQCHTDATTAHRRIAQRPERRAHADADLLAQLATGDRYFREFRRLAIEAPTIDVDTTDGYSPTIDELVTFIATR